MLDSGTLAHFTGTTQWHLTNRGMLGNPPLYATDGTLYVAQEGGAFWLLDIVWSVLPEVRRAEGRATAILDVDLSERCGTFKLFDRRGTLLYQQTIEYTDFPLPRLELVVTHEGDRGICCLPAED